MNDLRILVTGGTFDKVYDPLTEQLAFTDTHVDEILKNGRVTRKIIVKRLMLKDSLYMTDIDRIVVSESCRKSLEDRILITHGTGTMVKTAETIAQGVDVENKTIVIMGAMVPYSVSFSDAVFNFGFGTAAALCLPYGVYISMNARVFHWDNVKKNTEKGLFEPIN